MRVEAGVPCIKDARERLCHVRRMRDRDGRRRDGMLVGAGGGAAVGGTRIRHNTRLRLVRRTAAVVVGCSTGRWWARGVGQRRAVRAAATTHVVASSIVPRRRWPAARWSVDRRRGWGSGGRHAHSPRHTSSPRPSYRGGGGRRRDGALMGAGGGAAVGGTRTRHDTRRRLVHRTAAAVAGGAM